MATTGLHSRAVSEWIQVSASGFQRGKPRKENSQSMQLRHYHLDRKLTSFFLSFSSIYHSDSPCRHDEACPSVMASIRIESLSKTHLARRLQIFIQGANWELMHDFEYSDTQQEMIPTKCRDDDEWALACTDRIQLLRALECNLFLWFRTQLRDLDDQRGSSKYNQESHGFQCSPTTPHTRSPTPFPFPSILYFPIEHATNSSGIGGFCLLIFTR